MYKRACKGSTDFSKYRKKNQINVTEKYIYDHCGLSLEIFTEKNRLKTDVCFGIKSTNLFLFNCRKFLRHKTLYSKLFVNLQGMQAQCNNSYQKNDPIL